MATLRELAEKMAILFKEIKEEGYHILSEYAFPAEPITRVMIQDTAVDKNRYAIVMNDGAASRMLRIHSEDRSELRQRPEDQPLPVKGEESVHDAAIKLLESRRQLGIKRYGRQLETHNGRDASQDAVEECADLLVYLIQMRMEQK
jgi:hypothetical protein